MVNIFEKFAVFYKVMTFYLITDELLLLGM